MGQQRVRIFDTTLRDGEQAPGFSLRPAEKLLLARQLDALGVDIIEAGFPIASPADAEAVRRIATEIRRPVIACLARCHRADLEKAAWAIEPAARGRIHTFIATSDLHLQAKLRITPRAVSRGGGRRRPLRAAAHRRRAVLGRGRHAQRLRLPVPRRRGGHQGRRDHDQPAGYGRLQHAGRDARVLHAHPRARAERRQGGVQRALPRRPRAWRSRTRSRPCKAARGRSSARSTASASAPATPRSKRS